MDIILSKTYPLNEIFDMKIPCRGWKGQDGSAMHVIDQGWMVCLYVFLRGL